MDFLAPAQPAVIDRLVTTKRIGYVTDIEGNLDFFNRYVPISNTLYYNNEEQDPETGLPRLEIYDDAVFVFGGVRNPAFQLTQTGFSQFR